MRCDAVFMVQGDWCLGKIAVFLIKDLERSGCDLIMGAILAYAWRDFSA
jgi:hypothetical protein